MWFGLMDSTKIIRNNLTLILDMWNLLLETMLCNYMLCGLWLDVWH